MGFVESKMDTRLLCPQQEGDLRASWFSNESFQLLFIKAIGIYEGSLHALWAYVPCIQHVSD